MPLSIASNNADEAGAPDAAAAAASCNINPASNGLSATASTGIAPTSSAEAHFTSNKQHATAPLGANEHQDARQLEKATNESDGHKKVDNDDSSMLTLPPLHLLHSLKPGGQTSLDMGSPSAPALLDCLGTTQHDVSVAPHINSLFLDTKKRRTYAHDLLSRPISDEADADQVSISFAATSKPELSPIQRVDTYALSQHPTGSRSCAPGPYHQANCRLRQLLPHYKVTIAVTASWLHIFLAVAAVICFLGYIGIRIWYLVSGRTAAFHTQRTSVAYSWVVLVAEVAVSFVGFYGSQNYWKQSTKFVEMSTDDVKALTQVC
jgi:hypothetical protein